MTDGATIHTLNTFWKMVNLMNLTKPSWKLCLATTKCSKLTIKRFGMNWRKAKLNRSTICCLKHYAGSDWCTNTNVTFRMIHMTLFINHFVKRW